MKWGIDMENNFVLDFIKSKDIKEHLLKLKYNFSTLEKAFVIFHADHKTLSEKHDAYKLLIETEKDTEILKRNNTNYYPSLFELLNKYMEIEDSIIKEFYDEENAVYRFKYMCDDDKEFCEDFSTIYPTLYDCMLQCETEIADDDEVRFYVVRKDSLNQIGNFIDLTFNPSGKLLSVYKYPMDIKESDILSTFEGMWFPIPIPFKRGDIIIPNFIYHYKTHGEPMVLLNSTTWNLQEYLENGYTNRDYNLEKINKRFDNLLKFGDDSDMTFTGYFVTEEGDIYHECDWNFFNYEYYNDDYDGHLKMLKVMSAFEKGEVDLTFVLDAYQRIKDSIKLNNDKKYFNYIKEWYESFGIKFDD